MSNNIDLYSIVEIVSRHCSDKIQPSVRIGKKYMVCKEERLKNNIQVLTVRDISVMSSCKKTIRINAERFSWKILSAADIINEEKMKEATQNIKEAIKVLDSRFTVENQRDILIVPTAILEIAKHYSRLVLEQCRNTKTQVGLSQFTKLSRNLTAVLKDMDDHAEESLKENYKTLKEDVLSALSEKNNAWKLFCFENVVNIEYKRIDTKSKERVLDVQTKSCIALFFLAMFDEHEREVDKIIEDKIGEKPHPVIYEDVVNLRCALAKYARINELGFKENSNIRNGYKSAVNIVKNIKYNVRKMNFKLC